MQENRLRQREEDIEQKKEKMGVKAKSKSKTQMRGKKITVNTQQGARHVSLEGEGGGGEGAIDHLRWKGVRGGAAG